MSVSDDASHTSCIILHALPRRFLYCSRSCILFRKIEETALKCDDSAMIRSSEAIHTIPPIYDKQSRILILGSFPSVKSRQASFYYAHPQNRFWKVIALCTGEVVPQTVEEKKKLLLDHRIALWDVIASCEITGSSDSSIKDVKPNDIKAIIEESKITTIACNGNAAYELYMKLLFKDTGIKPFKLPSTSPANASWTLDKLCEQWKPVLH